MQPTNYTINAEDRTIGRIASEAASALIGKRLPSAKKNAIPNVKVSVINAAKTKIDEKKLTAKEYVTYSGYPAGIKYASLDKVISSKGVSEALRKAVWGMLPKNTLRSRMIKNLTISE